MSTVSLQSIQNLIFAFSASAITIHLCFCGHFIFSSKNMFLVLNVSVVNFSDIVSVITV